MLDSRPATMFSRGLLIAGWCVVIALWSLPGLAARAQSDESSIRRYSEDAERAMAAKDLNAAAEALEKLAKLVPNSADVRANLGMVYYTERRYTEAAQAFRKAVDLNPKIANGRLMLALCEADMGRWKEARPELEAAFRNPPNAEIGRTVGIELIQTDSALGEPAKALELSEEMLRRYPDDPEILYRASHLYGDRALDTMTRLVEVAPNSAWKLMAFSEALESQKHYDVAILQYQKALSIDSDLPGIHYRLGRAWLLSGPDNTEARDKALNEFKQAIANDPRNAGAEYEIGEIYRRSGDSEQASQHFFRAVEIDPDLEQAQIAVGRVLLSMNKPADAIPHLILAIKMDANNEVSHFLLAKAYKSMGNDAAAQKETALYGECHARLLSAFGNTENAPAGMFSHATTQQTVSPDAAAR